MNQCSGSGSVLRGDAELLDEVEAAAVDLPRLAGDALVGVLLPLGGREVVVERDEVERGADPDDAGDDVQPAEDEVEPVDRDTGRRRRSSAPPAVAGDGHELGQRRVQLLVACALEALAEDRNDLGLRPAG